MQCFKGKVSSICPHCSGSKWTPHILPLSARTLHACIPYPAHIYLYSDPNVASHTGSLLNMLSLYGYTSAVVIQQSGTPELVAAEAARQPAAFTSTQDATHRGAQRVKGMIRLDKVEYDTK